MNLDDLSYDQRQAYYNALELRLRRAHGNGLQKFLSEVNARVHGDNFVPASSFYSKGDLQCDGALLTPLTIFACYGPTNGGQNATAGAIAVAVKKVESDFLGAKHEWPQMKAWMWVTNYVEGAPAQITQQILKLRDAHPEIDITQMGVEQFRKLIFALPRTDVDDLVGPISTAADFRAMQLPEIQTLLADMTAELSGVAPLDDDPVVVPADKLDFNKLPGAHRAKILFGLQNAKVVSRYLDNHNDPTLDGRVAARFKAKYLDLKAQAYSPGDVMDALFDFALHGHLLTTTRDVAIWSVLAHLFEKCTIFEDKPLVAV